MTELSDVLSELSHKVGVILLLLGMMHLNNIITLHWLSQRKEKIINMFHIKNN